MLIKVEEIAGDVCIVENVLPELAVSVELLDEDDPLVSVC